MMKNFSKLFFVLYWAWFAFILFSITKNFEASVPMGERILAIVIAFAIGALGHWEFWRHFRRMAATRDRGTKADTPKVG